MSESNPLQPGGQPEQVEELEREIQRLRAENERLKKKVKDLEEELRASKRQAAPFSKGRRRPIPNGLDGKPDRAFSAIGQRRRSQLAARSWKRECQKAARIAAER